MSVSDYKYLFKPGQQHVQKLCECGIYYDLEADVNHIHTLKSLRELDIYHKNWDDGSDGSNLSRSQSPSRNGCPEFALSFSYLPNLEVFSVKRMCVDLRSAPLQLQKLRFRNCELFYDRDELDLTHLSNLLLVQILDCKLNGWTTLVLPASLAFFWAGRVDLLQHVCMRRCSGLQEIDLNGRWPNLARVVTPTHLPAFGEAHTAALQRVRSKVSWSLKFSQNTYAISWQR